MSDREALARLATMLRDVATGIERLSLTLSEPGACHVCNMMEPVVEALGLTLEMLQESAVPPVPFFGENPPPRGVG